MILFETREQYGLQTSHKIVCRGGFRWRYKGWRRFLPFLGPAFIAELPILILAILLQILQQALNTATCYFGL